MEISGKGGPPTKTISVAIQTTGDLNISNQARGKFLFFTQAIASATVSGSQALTLVGNSGYGGPISMGGGISDGVAGGKIAVVVNSPNGATSFSTNTNANTYTGETTLIAGDVLICNNAFGADGSSLAISGTSNAAPLRNGSPFNATARNSGILNFPPIFESVTLSGFRQPVGQPIFKSGAACIASARRNQSLRGLRIP